MLDTSQLTPRELEVYFLLIEGLRNREIAAKLCLSVRTVEGINSEIYAKTGMGRLKLIASSLQQSNRQLSNHYLVQVL